jgi:hypothetical protein
MKLCLFSKHQHVQVEDHGWPPVFALMLDAPWAGVMRAWEVAAQVVVV